MFSVIHATIHLVCDMYYIAVIYVIIYSNKYLNIWDISSKKTMGWCQGTGTAQQDFSYDVLICENSLNLLENTTNNKSLRVGGGDCSFLIPGKLNSIKWNLDWCSYLAISA